MPFDPDIPKSWLNQFLEEHPGYQQGHNEELDALLNPSITPKPLHIPMAGQYKKQLNLDIELYWAFDRNGMNPYHLRVEQLKSAGFDYATTKDVEMAIEETVQGRNAEGFSNEIRNGDRRLMKCAKQRWLEIRKSHVFQSLLMTHPRHMKDRDSKSVMTTGQTASGISTRLMDMNDPEVSRLTAKSVFSDAAQDMHEVSEGRVPFGNTSRIPKDITNKGV